MRRIFLKPRVFYICFWGLVIAGFATRLLFLDTNPPGFTNDENSMGYMASWIWKLQYWKNIYNEYGGSRGLMYFLTHAPFTEWIGTTVFSTRLTAALSGGFGILILGLAMLEMFYGHSRRRAIALFAMVFATTNIWYFTLSRIGYPASQTPLCVFLAIWLFFRSRRTGSWLDAFWAGLATGAGIYTYLGYLPFIPVIFLLGAWWLIREPRKYWARAIAFVVGFAALCGPYLYSMMFYYSHIRGAPHLSRFVEAWDGRLNNKQGWEQLYFIYKKLTVQVQGLYRQANYMGCHGPVNGGMLEGLLLVGVGAFLLSPLIYFFFRRIPFAKPGIKAPPAENFYLFLLGWFLICQAAVVLSVEWPHYLRGVASAPVVFIAGAIGLYHLAMWVRLLLYRLIGRYAPGAVVIALLIALGYHIVVTTHYNFIKWPSLPVTKAHCQYNFNAAAHQIHGVAQNKHVYLLEKRHQIPGIMPDNNRMLTSVNDNNMRLFFLANILSQYDLEASPHYSIIPIGQYEEILNKCIAGECAIVHFKMELTGVVAEIVAAAEEKGYKRTAHGPYMLYQAEEGL